MPGPPGFPACLNKIRFNYFLQKSLDKPFFFFMMDVRMIMRKMDMEKAKKRSGYLVPVLILFLVLMLVFMMFNQKKQIDRLKAGNVFLSVGDDLKQLELVDIANNQKTHKLNDGVSILFVFEKPCSPCNKNINFWNKIAILLREKVQTYGIIEEDFSNARETKLQNRVVFPLYAPVDVDEFRKVIPTSINLPQTVVVMNGKVSNLYVGQLSPESVKDIMQIAGL